MKLKQPVIISSLLLIGLLLGSCSNNLAILNRKDYDKISSNYDYTYESGNWEEISYEKASFSLGNHRAVFEIPPGSDIAYLQFLWRRSDFIEKENGIFVQNATSGDTVKTIRVIEAGDEAIDIVFKPEGDGTQYYLYYFPFNTTGGYYPTVSYPKISSASDNEWWADHKDEDYSSLPQGKITRVQSINDFNSFYPMEIAASESEVQNFISSNPKSYYLFPEFREYPIIMKKNLPLHWITRGSKTGIKDNVKKGEYYVFQLGVFAVQSDLKNITLQYSELRSGSKSIASSAFSCFNLEGISLDGEYFQKVVNVEEGTIQPLWIGIQIPEQAEEGSFTGEINFIVDNEMAERISLELQVTDEVAIDHGDDNPALMSRLRWLNSTLGSGDDYIIPPFHSVEVENKIIKILGREVVISETGFPSEMNSYFAEEMTFLNSTAQPILEAPMSFNVHSADKQEWSSNRFEINNESKGKAVWTVHNQNDFLYMQVKGEIEYDGMLIFDIQITARQDFEYRNMVLEIPMQPEASTYILGLGHKGSRRPDKIDWKWDIANHHEGAWLGNINKGLQFVLRDQNYERPLNTNFYQSKPLMIPSWDNQGRGGISISSLDNITLVENYTGAGNLSMGDTLNFTIRFLITPFKLLDTKQHFNTRFVHKYVPVDSVVDWGGTVVNVHHANEINPYINYPFYHLENQKTYIDEAHSRGIKVKLYNTIRELTYKSYELFPMRSFGDEIFNDGDGGGHPWLQEHLRNGYHKAWHAWRVNDAAILNKGTSRWTNYYIEGLGWLARNQEIDGLYLDDIAFSRETVKRMVSVLNRERPEIIIDLHSANQFNSRDGFINSAFLYMEHFPYITRLWFGEYFEYDLGPDYWFTEISGLPFGLMGEMLQDCGHPYRGLLYGMSTRMYGDCDPRPIWKLFNEFEIHNSRMLGYWLQNSPVETGENAILATAYVKKDEVMIVTASWSETNEQILLRPDWEMMEISNPDEYVIIIPEIDQLQTFKELEISDLISVPANQGLVMIIRKK